MKEIVFAFYFMNLTPNSTSYFDFDYYDTLAQCKEAAAYQAQRFSFFEVPECDKLDRLDAIRERRRMGLPDY